MLYGEMCNGLKQYSIKFFVDLDMSYSIRIGN